MLLDVLDERIIVLDLLDKEDEGPVSVLLDLFSAVVEEVTPICPVNVVDDGREGLPVNELEDGRVIAPGCTRVNCHGFFEIALLKIAEGCTGPDDVLPL